MQDISLIELNKPGLFEKFKQQLYKDFEMSGCETFTPLIISNELEHIHAGLHQSLNTLYTHHSSLYQSLLYRIDISEQQIGSALSKKPDLPFVEVVAELVIKRILQKVILKQLYSDHEHKD